MLLINIVNMTATKRKLIYLLASRKVTSLSSSKSFLLPTRRIMIAGLANVRASVNQFVSALKVSLDEMSYTSKAPDQDNGEMLKFIHVSFTSHEKGLKRHWIS